MKIIGIDFGGTKILTGAINEHGELLCEPVSAPTGAEEHPDNILGRLFGTVDSVLKKLQITTAELDGIGIGSTGPLYLETGTILENPNLPTLNFFPLKEKLISRYGVPVYMDNDASCLIYGETLFGCGKGLNNVVGFTLGTGLGCAVILKNKIFSGSTGTSGEIWISPHEEGIIEDYVSGRGVSKTYKDLCGKELSAREIKELAEKNDSDALETWRIFGRHLAAPASWAINIIDPEIVILGGSISNAYKFFGPSFIEHLRKHICPVPSEKLRIECGTLEGNAGFIGAAALVLKGGQ